MTSSTILTLPIVRPPVRGRKPVPVPVRRQLMDAVQDFSITATAESLVIRELVHVALSLCAQKPARPDLAIAALTDAIERSQRIEQVGKALSAEADIEADREVPDAA